MKIEGSVEVEFGGQQFVLLPDRAVWWPTQRTLIVADVHLGKGTAFRSAGVPVPSGGSEKDLNRISALIERTNAKQLLILGDLIHAKSSRKESLHEQIARWRESQRDVDIVLVRGNHDRASGKLLKAWRIHEVDEPFEAEGIHCTHHPPSDSDVPTMAGHLHPVYAMTDYDGSNVTVDCFVVHAGLLIFPAFGTFTGGSRVTSVNDSAIFIVAGRRVVRVDG